jgi:CRP-like cAMP-binding protein
MICRQADSAIKAPLRSSYHWWEADMHARASSPNHFLANLIQPDFELVRPYLRSLELVPNQVLAAAGQDLEYAYLPHAGVISLVVCLAHGEPAEVAMVGSHSIFGASAALVGPTALTTAIVHLGGMCSALPIKRLREAIDRSTTLRTALNQHEQAIFVQSQQTAACNLSHPTISRLARWLLRVRDASGRDGLQFTEEFLSQVLGVQRNAVSYAASMLKDKGLVRFSHARISIHDVTGLNAVACECHRTVTGDLLQLRDGTVH